MDVHPLRLAGESYAGKPGEVLEVRSPYDGSLIGTVPACTADDVDRAVQSARRALDAGPLAPHRRAEILDRAAVALAARIDEFGTAIAREAAKPIRTARVGGRSEPSARSSSPPRRPAS